MKVIVCGGRFYANKDEMFGVLDSAHAECPFTTLAHGDYRGADRLADQWAKERGVMVQRFPADWAIYGDSAGPRRNSRMLAEFRPHRVFAFAGADGTADMVRKALRAGVPVWDGSADPVLDLFVTPRSA